jgi:hypothetical protein
VHLVGVAVDHPDADSVPAQERRERQTGRPGAHHEDVGFGVPAYDAGLDHAGKGRRRSLPAAAAERGDST